MNKLVSLAATAALVVVIVLRSAAAPSHDVTGPSVIPPSENVIYPTIPSPEQTVKDYLQQRYVVVAPAHVSDDDKVALVSAVVPSGGLMRCTLNLHRDETDPPKLDAARWHITSLTCPLPPDAGR